MKRKGSKAVHHEGNMKTTTTTVPRQAFEGALSLTWTGYMTRVRIGFYLVGHGLHITSVVETLENYEGGYRSLNVRVDAATCGRTICLFFHGDGRRLVDSYTNYIYTTSNLG